jgi:hypothetical protein
LCIGFISLPKEGLLGIFIAIKNPSPRPGLNPRTLGPMASTLTITPPMTPLLEISTMVSQLQSDFVNGAAASGLTVAWGVGH